MHASIIICTRNRADSLQETLKSFEQINLPKTISVDLLVVDNGSSDHTKQVVHQCTLSHIPVRYVFEERKGLSRARNRALRETAGEIILFTDDDVRPSLNWIAGMCQPLTNGQAEAVAGGVRPAPHLLTPWLLNSPDKWMVALTDGVGQRYLRDDESLIGASMGFLRRVLEKVPEFDVELGAGAIGSAEDTVFTKQLKLAGYRCYADFEITVEHHFDPNRLTVPAFLDLARAIGRSAAYIQYHFEHKVVTLPSLKLKWIRLMRSLRPRGSLTSPDEGPPHVEVHEAFREAFFAQYMIECRRPRNYERLGLIKVRGIKDDANDRSAVIHGSHS